MDRKHRHGTARVPVTDFTIGGGSSLALIAGPCVIEEQEICLEIITECQRICDKHGVNYIFKASYDKANKTIGGSYRGPGRVTGMRYLADLTAKTDVPILTDIHERFHCARLKEVVDILQIPALLSKQIDLITAAAGTGLPINIKKGQFTAPWEMANVIERLADEGFHDVMITERGTCFGYRQLVNDMRSLQILTSLGKPVIYDVSHSVAVPLYSSARDYIRPLVRSAVANGVDGVFVEVHPEPEKARSDVAGTLALSEVEPLVREMVAIDRAVNDE